MHNRIEGDFILLYGTELEVCVRPKPSLQVGHWDDVAQNLSASLEQNGIHNEVLIDSKESDYQKWIIASDGSIERGKSANKWGLELVSSICLPREWWSRTCSVVWGALTSKFDVLESPSCGTHVHVSMYRGSGWEGAFGKLQRIAKAVVYFERCIDSLMPDHRLRNVFCKSNRYNSTLRSSSVPTILKMIDGIQEGPEYPGGPDGREKLVDLLCPSGDSVKRYYRWNFTPLLRPDRKTRTIEFRQPPGSTTALETAFWCQFTIYFVYGAVISLDTFDLGDTATLGQLRDMVLRGEELGAGWGYNAHNLERGFEGKTQRAEGPYEEPSPNSEDRIRMDAKERVENLKFDRVSAAAELPFEDYFSDEENA